MALTLEIVTPEGKVYSDTVEYVLLPGVEGEVGILPDHVPMLVTINPGEVHVIRSGHKESIAVDKGFARLMSNTVSILTEAAIDVEEIDLSKVEEAKERAEKALEEARTHKEIDPAEIERLEAITRFALAQKLAKQKKL